MENWLDLFPSSVTLTIYCWPPQGSFEGEWNWMNSFFLFKQLCNRISAFAFTVAVVISLFRCSSATDHMNDNNSHNIHIKLYKKTIRVVTSISLYSTPANYVRWCFLRRLQCHWHWSLSDSVFRLTHARIQSDSNSSLLNLSVATPDAPQR